MGWDILFLRDSVFSILALGTNLLLIDGMRSPRQVWRFLIDWRV
jgi:hypothetical protein